MHSYLDIRQREMPNERGRRLRDREEVCLETRDDKDVGELDWAEYKRRRRPREKLGAVPDLDRDRCGRLDVHEQGRGRDHVGGSTRVDHENAGDGIFHSGDGCSDIYRAGPSRG
jgi:hypothetical protein